MCVTTGTTTIYQCNHLSGLQKCGQKCAAQLNYLNQRAAWINAGSLGNPPVSMCQGTAAHRKTVNTTALCPTCTNQGGQAAVGGGTWMPGI